MADKKQISSILKEAAVLFIITLAAAVLLGFVNEVTKGPISEQLEKEKAEAYKKVFEDAERIVTDDKELLTKIENSQALLNGASLGSMTINEAGIAEDAQGETLGYVLTATSPNGYNGDITIIMGYTIDHKITKIEFLTINETTGFGLNALEPSYKDQYNEIDATNPLHASGTSLDGSEIDGISGATYSSDAILEAVNAGIIFAKDLLKDEIGGAD